MRSISLSDLSLLYIESLKFKNHGFSLEIAAVGTNQRFLIYLNNILNFNFSRDSLDDEEGNEEINILEVVHEYRTLAQNELKSYSYLVDDVKTLPKLHIVTIQGSGSVMSIICKKVEVR
ncbi:hypothetical protein [Coleofasciculus sp. FACHB-SPT9]|uniref:hypothetical protein n=1 Tax=Cyanophyceae TaxID=3028117 RepID=UPI0016868158|nr:hypothetical protein [Coleofasciculus sp. FACHB-SPT9]MBD1889318.1 hypothetical protein [Coleofasciculus sp. FACHB-SPT9]